MQIDTESTALVVDDNQINRRVAVAMLRKLGFEQVLQAEHGQDALEQVRKAPAGLILMDCDMPVMDGYQATEAIRRLEQQESRPPCCIIALTAHSRSEDEAHCLAVGMDYYLQKPIRVEALHEALTRLAGGLVEGHNDVPTDEPDISRAIGPDTQPPPLDPSRFSKMHMLLRDGIRVFYEDFLSSLHDKLSNMREQPELEPELASRLIHSIKGSAGNVGALQLEQLAQVLEQRLQSGETDILYRESANLKQVVDELERTVQEALSGL